ncbi:hypothetical protein ABPG73_000607 [Tetrahymena malaccensis]
MTNIFREQERIQNDQNNSEQQNQLACVQTRDYVDQTHLNYLQMTQVKPKKCKQDEKSWYLQHLCEAKEQDEEEISIWNEKGLKEIGINTEEFIDERGKQLEFYELYRLRSILYQPNYVSRLDTINEVQCLSNHFKMQISINYLKHQQIYLDKHFPIQKKQQNKKLISILKLKNQYEESLEDDFSRIELSHRQTIKKANIKNEVKQIINQNLQEIQQQKKSIQPQLLLRDQQNLQTISLKNKKTYQKICGDKQSLIFNQKNQNNKQNTVELHQKFLSCQELQNNNQINHLQLLDTNYQVQSQQILKNQNSFQILNENNKSPTSNYDNQIGSIETVQNSQLRKQGVFQTIFSVFSLFKQKLLNPNQENKN